MMTPICLPRPARLFAAAAALTTLSAPAAESASARASEPAVELSPFVVNSSRDTGYQASTTMAGTRLDTPIKDLGAAVSIFTKDFLEDIGATNAADLLIYAPGMEAAGPGGNFSAATPADSSIGITTNSREEPESPSRARGLGAPTFTRNFFNTLIPTDSYNTERVTVLRGPNSALVGAGNPSGIVDTSVAQADLRRNRNKVSVRLDENSGTRTVADFNRVLIPERLAARLIGLDSREKYDQRPAFQNKQRLYGTLAYQPFKSTLLRGSFETGRSRANQPINVALQSSIAQEWYDQGRPGFDWTYYDDPARNPLAASQVSTNVRPNYMGLMAASSLLAVYNSASDRRPSAILQTNFPTTTGTTANAIRTATFHPTLNRDLATDSGQFVATLNIQEIAPASYWIGKNVLPGNLPGLQPPGIRLQGFTDSSMFDWNGRMIDETARFNTDFHAASFSIAQTAWRNRVGLELAYDKQRQDQQSRASFLNGNGLGQTQVRIDTSVMTPEGLPNPNLGRPFLIADNYRYVKTYSDDETLRATGYLKYDFKDLSPSWGKWIGAHTLGAVIERYRRDQIANQSRLMFDGPAVRDVVTNINSRLVRVIAYLGPSLIGNNNPIKLEPITLPMPQPGAYGDISTFVRAAGTTDAGAYVKSPASVVELNSSGNARRQVIAGRAVTLQSNWLQGLVATVIGWRRDVDYADPNARLLGWGQEGNPVTGPNDPGRLEWNFDEFKFPYTPPKRDSADTKTYSVVLNWPKQLVRLPPGTDFSVFYNTSDNFTAAGVRRDFYANPLPSPKGKTEEYGFNLTLFDHKLVLRGNRFESYNQNIGFQGTVANGGPRMWVGLIANWSTEANVNPQMVASRNADIQTVRNYLPANITDLYLLQVSGTAPNITATFQNSLPGGANDTQDQIARGLELEAVYNPTPNWRILANVAKQETVRTNMLPFMKAFAAQIAPLVAKLGDRPVGNYPTGYQPGQPLPANVETVAQRVDSLMTVPMSLELASENMASPEQRKWRFNLVTSYRFGRGGILGEKLKGWSIGGGARWQSRFAIGYPSTRLPNTVPVYDIAHPWYAPADLNIDGFVGYTRKIWGGRIDWKMQINGTNLFRQRDLIPMSAQPWGQVAIMRLAPEQRWFLNNTFSF